MAVSVLLLAYPRVILIFLLLHVGECLLAEPIICDTSCLGSQSTDFSAQKGVTYTYRYSTAISTTLHGSGGGRSGLALDCVVDIEAVSDCHLTLQIRNSQIKRLSSQREHSVPHLKTLRESLERTRLKFSLQGGKVTALCLQEGEEVWALNMKRALLSMLQTSPMVSKFREETETDVHGTCTSRYERRGPTLLKSRDLRQCQQSRLHRLWPHSVTLTEDTMVRMELHCVQRPGQSMVEEVNCTEVVSLAASLTPLGPVKTKSVSTLLLLKTQPGASTAAESPSRPGVFTDLQFEDEGPARPTSLQEVGRTVALLCSVASDPQLITECMFVFVCHGSPLGAPESPGKISQDFLELVFQLKDMTLPHLKTLWQESSFKCRNDWQPLLEALPACGSENCILLLTELVLNNELEEGQVNSFLTTLALIPHPSPQIIGSINGFLARQELRAKAMLAGSSLIYQMCQRFQASCGETPQVQFFMQTIQETLNAGCEEKEPHQIRELIYALKSIGNSGVNAASFIPLLRRCLLGHQTELELKVAAVQAFRRFPCSADRSVLLQLYRRSREDPEVRIAAYQQLMLCPDQEVFEVVKTTLKNETSSQVGSFVWSHLTNSLRSEDPMKQTLIQLLPDDIISRDFEAEFWKYSSYSDHTFVSGFGIKNLETSLIFSPKSFLPRSISANLTMYLHGRAHNLLEVDVHMENFEPLLRSAFGQKTEGEPTAKSGKQETRRRRRRADDGNGREKETCLSDTDGYLRQARAVLFGRRKADEERPRCRVSVKIFGNELSVFTCDDVRDQIHQGSLSLAGLAVKLLKGHEVHLSHRGVLMAEELRLSSLSGVPINLGVNMTSLLSLHLKGNVNYRDTSHFSLNGYVRPNAYVGLSARMGVDGAPGQAAVEWLAELRSAPSLDGSFQLQEGREVRVTLNTPQDFMDVISLSSRVFQLSGDHREEMKGPKSRIQKTTCTPKSWSKMIGWQLCSNVSYPSLPSGVALPPTGPAHLSLRLLKLDRGLHYYLLEAASSLHYKKGTWLPREASIHLLLSTPQSSIPRDMSLDLAFSSHRVLLRIKHPLKTIVLQGQFDQERNIKSGKLELAIDSVHFYIMGLVDSTSFQSEQKTRYHLEAKMAADLRPMILSANVTQRLGRKSSLSATLKNVFRETASLSVALERRQDLSRSSQYSVEVELFLPGLVGSRMLGLMEQKGALWSSVLRVKYGLRGDSRNLHQECYTSQRLRRGRDSNLTYIMRADHEFYCTNTEPINHKIHMKHEESPSHIKSILDLSYGKHWDEINNKHTLLLSQSFRNQSTQNHTSYTLEFNLQVPGKNLNYRTQLMHSRLLQRGSESSTHLKINYNNLMPLVAGLHWKSPPENSLHKKWEGTFNMDTPGQYIHAAYRLSRPNRHALQLTSELTASKWLSVRNLVLDGFYRDRGREKAARLEVHTPAATYVQAGVWGAVGRQAVKAHGSLASLWTPPLKANVSLESSKSSHALLLSATCGRQNVSFTAAVSGADKNLKKRQAILKMAFTKPKSPTMEVELEGWVEELSRDRKMYQKAAQLQFRQPFQNFPQTLLLRETFTVDLVKGLYILESKAGFHDNKEVIHTLTLGYKPPSPFVCSALIHTFSSDTFPSDSEVCVSATSNQTHRDLQGTLQINGEDKLSLFGQIHQSPSNSNQQAITIKANFTHELQLQLPSSAVMEGYLHWILKHSTGFDYQARGKLGLERQECTLSVQLNGTAGRVGLRSSLAHPFKSKIPKALEVKAAADASESGKRSSSLCVRANGKNRVTVTGQMFHRLQNPDREVRLDLDLSQNLLPSVGDLQLNMSANVSADSVALHGSVTQGQEALLVQVKGSRINSQVLRLALLGNVHHSMSVLEALPSVLGLDGVLERFDTLTEGHLRVNVMEAVHSIELRHQLDAAEGLVKGEGTLGGDYQRTQAQLCVRSGLQNLCANVSRHLENRGNGQLSVQLSHSFHRLNTTGVPGDSSAKVKWTQDEVGLSVLVELQAGAEHVRAEFLRDRTDQRWSYFSRLQHQVKALQTRGLPGSFQARAQHQLETGGFDINLVLSVEDERTAEMFFSVGSKNKTSALVVMLWQRMKLLQGHIPNSLRMNCTGVSTEDRLSAHCFGNVANRPVEVRAVRSDRPHCGLCYGLSLIHLSLRLQAKGCYRSGGQMELRANLNHSSVRFLTYLGLPSKSGVRLLLWPGPQRWVLRTRMVAGPWRADLRAGLRVESRRLYAWHGLLQYGTHSDTQKAVVTGRVKMKRLCDVRAEASVSWNSVTSYLMAAVRCTEMGRAVRVQVGNILGLLQNKMSLVFHGETGSNGLMGFLSYEDQQGFLKPFLSTLAKEHKVEVGWNVSGTLISNKVDFHGSGQLHHSSFSGRAKLLINDGSAQINATAVWKLFTSFSASCLQKLKPQRLLTMTASATPSQAQVEMESDACQLLLLANRCQEEEKESKWTLFAHQRCFLLKTLIGPQASANISVSRSGCDTKLRAVLQAGGEQKGSISVSVTCSPHRGLRASVLHFISAVKTFRCPTSGALPLNVSGGRLPQVDASLELGRCYLRGSVGDSTAPQAAADGVQSLTVNVSSHCPLLQGWSLPQSLALRGLLSVAPCQLTVSSSLRLDDEDASLELNRSCVTPYLFGSISQSFSGLKSLGLPQTISVEASALEGSDQAGAVTVDVGTCRIRARRIDQDRGTGRRLWAWETDCPGLQVHVNGSVWELPGNVWTAVMETDLKGRRAFLRLEAEPGPELRVEGVLDHDSPPITALPNSSTLRFSSSGLHVAEVLVQTKECRLRAGGDVMSRPGLQVSLLYHNNCSMIQEWFSPNIMQASGSLLISQASVSSHIFMVVDGKELHTVLSAGQTEVHKEAFLHLNHSVPLLKKLGLPVNVSLAVNCESHNNGSRSFMANGRTENQRFSQELKMEETSETVRVQSELKHEVNYLDKLGVPGSNSIQVELGSAEGRILSLESQCGAQQSGLRLELKTIPEIKEVRGTLWHGSSWLHRRGLPLRISGLCSMKGALSELRSRAELSVDGRKLLTSGLNVSGAASRLAGLLSFSPAALNQTWTQHKLDAVLTVQFKGPLRSASLDVHRQDWRFRLAGEAGDWGTRGGTKEARFTLRHTERGEASPAFQMEGWGRLTESLLRGSMAVNPELSSSFALIVQGHTSTPSKELMVNVVHSAPQLLPFLPPQLHLRSQLNQSQSSVAVLVEVLSGRRKLWALGELAAMEGGYRQTVEVRHSFPQLQPVPRTVAVRTLYEARRWRHLIQQTTVWGSHQFSLSALHSAAPGPDSEPVNRTLKVQVGGLPRLSGLELVHESSKHSRLDSVSLGWKRQGHVEQVHVLRSWSRSEETNQTKLELKHPFCSVLSQLSLHTLSLRSPRKSSSSLQTHLSWDGSVPVNISLTLNKLSSSVGRACVLLSAKRMLVSSGKGCVSMGNRGNLYSQTADVTWHNKSFRQGMTYQKSAEGLHGLQLYVDLDRVSPAPCHSHMLLAKVQTNLRDRLEHRVELGVCPEQPTLWWSGSHRVNSGEELIYSQCNVSVTGQPLWSCLTLAVINSSTAQGTNISLYTESVVGNWSLLLGSRGLSGPQGASLQVHATLDRRHQVWVNGTLGGRCLRTAAGYMNGPGLCEDISAAVCAGMNHSFKAEVQRRERCRETETLGRWSLKTANRRLMMSARGCLDRLTAVEERLHFLSSEIQKEFLERRKALQRLLTETTEQPADTQLLQAWSSVPLLVSQHAEGLLGRGSAGPLSLWLGSSLRRALTGSLPDLLAWLQQASLQGQQELRRPLATLAGVYQDVKGQRLEAAWREAVRMWTGRLLDVLPAELENRHLRALAAAGASALTAALDVAAQQSCHWVEARLVTALSGLRKRLASLYTLSRRDCAVAVSVPLLNLNLSRAAEGGLLETVLEEWLLGPLRALASVRPAAELYRFKRRIMDSPFRHQALLVADQFVVTFDGRLYELPVTCPLLLAQDVRTEPSFTLLLGADAQSSLLIHLDNSSVHIQRSGQVKADCKNVVPHGPLSSRGPSVKKGSNKVQVSNQEGQSVSCDLQLELCSFTLDGWLHGSSAGLLGTNDNDAGNDFSLRDGSQAKTLEEFFHSWELEPNCSKSTEVSTAAASAASCASFFSSPDSPLGSCFRVVDPAQFLSVCGQSSSKAPCRLAAAFVHLCQQNYIPVEIPGQCMKV